MSASLSEGGSHPSMLAMDASNIPQWKRDYLEKKRALSQYQIQRKNSQTDEHSNLNQNQNGLNGIITSSMADQNIASDHGDSKHNGLVNNGKTDNRFKSAEEIGSVDSSSSSESEDEAVGNRKSGGYSFITGEKFSPASTESEPENDEKGSSETTESDTEGSTELKYKPGFVLKLLDKWSTISYQGSSGYTDAPANSNINNSSLTTSLGSQSNPRVGLNATASRPIGAPAPFYLSKSRSMDQNMIGSINNNVSQTQTLSSSSDTSPVLRSSASFEELKRRPSYRAPSEIILIEGGSGRGNDENVTPNHDSLTSEVVADTTGEESAVVNPATKNSETTSPDVQTDWEADLPIRQKVLLAKAVFESNVSPIAPPRRRRSGPVISPVTTSSSNGSQAGKDIPEKGSNSYNIHSQAAKSLADGKSTLNVAAEIDHVTAAASDVKLENQSTVTHIESSAKAKVSSVRRRGESPPSTSVRRRGESPPSTSQPLFTSVKLKPTRHSLYETSDNVSQSQSIPVNGANEHVAVVKLANEHPSATKVTNEHAAVVKLANKQTVVVKLSNERASISKVTNEQTAVTKKTNDDAATFKPANHKSDSRTGSAEPANHKSDRTGSAKPATHKSDRRSGSAEPANHKSDSRTDSADRLVIIEKPKVLPNGVENSAMNKSVDWEEGKPSTKPDKVADITNSSQKSMDSRALSKGEPVDVSTTSTNALKYAKDKRLTSPSGHKTDSDLISITKSDDKKLTNQSTDHSLPSNLNQDSSILKSSTSSGTVASIADIPDNLPSTAQHVDQPVLHSSKNSSKTNDINKPSPPAEPILPTPAQNQHGNTQKPKTVMSLNDIPSAPNQNSPNVNITKSSHGKVVATTPKSDNGNDLQAVLRRRQERAASDLPVTNIDDILKPQRGTGSRVFDTRKSMGSKRKVPEYEKIRDGPVQQFEDTKIVVGKGCLRLPDESSTMKKNISFSDLNMAAVHEYPSEKVMIEQIPKEEGAVYWDDPDHLQAAPDRSIDEPETTTAASSLRGKPSITGSLGSHRSAYHGDYSFGQTKVSPSENSVVRADNSKTEDSDVIDLKPAEEHQVKSWSYDDSSDMLF